MKSAGSKIAAAAAVVIIGVIFVMMLPMLAEVAQDVLSRQKDNPVITILQPESQQPSSVPRGELVSRALDLINEDRAKFGMPPVMLSQNQAAQAHAEDVFNTKQISHWMTNGEKPYMTYTRYGGDGSVQQNVAIAGFTSEQYSECVNNVLYNCEEIDPVSTIQELQHEMVYDDKECCNDGHKDNILGKYHTHVSIGIVYDRYYLAFVQNFENDYGLDVQVSDGRARIYGVLAAGTLDQITIHYDRMPTPATYEQNKHMLSYSSGDLVAAVAKPLPLGYSYQEPDGYSLIVANRWDVRGNSMDVTFDLADVVDEDGVYTLAAIVKDGDETFEATSHSVFIDSS